MSQGRTRKEALDGEEFIRYAGESNRLIDSLLDRGYTVDEITIILQFGLGAILAPLGKEARQEIFDSVSAIADLKVQWEERMRESHKETS